MAKHFTATLPSQFDPTPQPSPVVPPHHDSQTKAPSATERTSPRLSKAPRAKKTNTEKRDKWAADLTIASRPLTPLEQEYYAVLNSRESTSELLTRALNKGPHTPSSTSPHAFAAEAHGCSRALSYRLASPTVSELLYRGYSSEAAHSAGRPDEPLTLKSLVNFFVGDCLHLALQLAFERLHPGFTQEFHWRLPVGSRDPIVTGRADGLYADHSNARTLEDLLRAVDPEHWSPVQGGRDHPLQPLDHPLQPLDHPLQPLDHPLSSRIPGLTVVEIKTKSMSYFRAAVQANTPDAKHVVQAGLAALATGATKLHIVYLNKNPMDDFSAVAEWIIPVNRDLLVKEYHRLAHDVLAARRGVLADRIHLGAPITDPELTKDPCGWCTHLAQCAIDGPGILTVAPPLL